jgi:uncharacterized DUF497 family protein
MALKKKRKKKRRKKGLFLNPAAQLVLGQPNLVAEKKEKSPKKRVVA